MGRLALLYVTALLCGFCVLALELLGVRLLQPVFGCSIDVWAAVISVFLLSLSLGYALGGRWADQPQARRFLGRVIVAASLCYLLLPVYVRPFLEVLPVRMQLARWGALVAASVLFLPPSLFLGCVTPLLVRLAFTQADRLGRMTGAFYALGTVGNVLGVLVTDYWLLVSFSLPQNLLIMGVMLGVLGCLHLAGTGERRTAVALVGLAAVVGCWYRPSLVGLVALRRAAHVTIVDHRQSLYTDMTWVVDRRVNALQLWFGRWLQGSVSLLPSWDTYDQLSPDLRHLRMPAADTVAFDAALNPGTLATAGCFWLYPIAVLAQPGRTRLGHAVPTAAAPRILVVGLGAGAGIGVLAHHFPNASMSVVELDALVLETTLAHYPLVRWLTTQRTADGRPRLRLIAADARQFIRHPEHFAEEPDAYDVVILDAFASWWTVPPHLATREFFEETLARLSPEGVLLCNIPASTTGTGHLVLSGIIRTLRAAGLRETLDIPVLSMYEEPANFSPAVVRNHVVLASRTPLDPAGYPEGWRRFHSFSLYPEFPVGRFVSAEIDWVQSARDVFRKSLAAAAAGAEAEDDQHTRRLSDAPLFTDDQPIADLLYRR